MQIWIRIQMQEIHTHSRIDMDINVGMEIDVLVDMGINQLIHTYGLF